MENKKVIILGIFIFGLIGYFLFYVPHEEQVSYKQNSECNDLVTKYETTSENKIIQLLGNTNGFIFDLPKSHFSKKLNTCLGYFQSNYSIDTATQGEILYSKSIVDVVGNNNILTSDTESVTSKGVSTTTLSNGVSSDDFEKQEVILMSE